MTNNVGARIRAPMNVNSEIGREYAPLQMLPPVSEMMRGAGLAPKKSLGQNFLFDLNLTGKIARSVPDIENTTVVEVGPGPGGLTRSLLMAGAKKVIAIEKDKTTAPILEQIRAAAGKATDGTDRLEIIYGDALKVFTSLVKGGKDFLNEPKANLENPGGINISKNQKSPQDFVSGQAANKIYPPFNKGGVAICSNLPYNIGTELLIRWLHIIANQNGGGQLNSELCTLNSLTLMFQREVAERIVARVGDTQYGRLSVLTALVADAKILFNVPRTAFTPMPKVESAVVQIIGKREEGKGNFDIAKIETLTAKLFGQRRKMIRGIMPCVDWSRFGLTGTERAEELSPQKFVEIAEMCK